MLIRPVMENMSWKCVFQEKQNCIAGQEFFLYIYIFLNPAMSEPQRQLKFRSVLLAEKESNLLHEDSSWMSSLIRENKLLARKPVSSERSRFVFVWMWQEGRTITAVSLCCFKKCFPSLDVLSVHYLNSAFNFWDFLCSSVLIPKVTLQLKALWGIAYT